MSGLTFRFLRPGQDNGVLSKRTKNETLYGYVSVHIYRHRRHNIDIPGGVDDTARRCFKGEIKVLLGGLELPPQGWGGV